jgi:phage FluMu gp28-like protein
MDLSNHNRPSSSRSAKRKTQNSTNKISAAQRSPEVTRALDNLLPYQQRWATDDSPLKIVVKARQIGYSFAATLRAVVECLERKTTWIFLSKGERQSRLLMEKVADHVRSFGLVCEALESTYFEGTLTRQLETRFPNGSVIYGLPANPDTARGYTGNVTLDEFAFHTDAAKIYSALYPTITRGYGLEVISTPNGTQGKFYELAKTAGLVDCRLPMEDCRLGPIENRPSEIGNSPAWSPHRTDIYEAVRQGLSINVRMLRSGCDDESTWQQEFCCEFVSNAENFFPPELLAACLSSEASSDTPLPSLASGFAGGSRSESTWVGSSPEPPIPNPEFFAGIDIGRKHDRTVIWVDEVTAGSGHPERSDGSSWLAIQNEKQIPRFARNDSAGGRSVTRLVRTFANAPFSEQLAYARELLGLRGGNGEPLISRVAIDATGIGLPLAESLAQEFGPRVEPVVFTAAMKENLAFRTRRRMEDGLTRLPDTRDVRRAFSAVKKFVTAAGNLRFDAARTEAGHADEFWAKALADYAADCAPVSSARDGFLAAGAPIINPGAFAVVEPGWKAFEF